VNWRRQTFFRQISGRFCILLSSLNLLRNRFQLAWHCICLSLNLPQKDRGKPFSFFSPYRTASKFFTFTTERSFEIPAALSERTREGSLTILIIRASVIRFYSQVVYKMKTQTNDIPKCCGYVPRFNFCFLEPEHSAQFFGSLVLVGLECNTMLFVLEIGSTY